MPHTSYALFGAIRSHQIKSPSVAKSIRFGTPNACNLCHLDKSLAWAQEQMQRWTSESPLPLTPDQQSVSAAALWMLKGNAAQRAIAAWHAGWKPAQDVSGTDWLAPMLAPLLSDPYGVVRYVARESLKTLPGFAEFRTDFLAPESRRNEDQLEAVRRWAAQSDEPSRTGTSVLRTTDGSIMTELRDRLIRERDNRPVRIQE
jgi:hypothetical protein